MNKTINNGRVSRGYFSVTDRHRRDITYGKVTLLRFGLFNASCKGRMCCILSACYAAVLQLCVFIFSHNTYVCSVLLLSVFFKSLCYGRCSAQCNTIFHRSPQPFVLNVFVCLRRRERERLCQSVYCTQQSFIMSTSTCLPARISMCLFICVWMTIIMIT